MAIPVGPCVKLVRENSGLTLREAAETIGLSATALYKFEEFLSCYDPFMPVKNGAFGFYLEKFLIANLNNIKTPLLKKYVKKIIDNNSIEVNLFQDHFYHSLLSFLELSLVRMIGEFGPAYGGLFYILRDLLLFKDSNSVSKKTIAIGRIDDDVTSFFLGETFNNQWGKNRTRRRKNAYKFDDIIFTQEESKDVIGYLSSTEGNTDFIGRVFYDVTFVMLLFYLLLEKFSCKFYTRDNNEHEQKLWDYFHDMQNEVRNDSVDILNDPSVYCFFDKNAVPLYRDFFVLNSRYGKASICCRSIVGGYPEDMFLLFGDLLK